MIRLTAKVPIPAPAAATTAWRSRFGRQRRPCPAWPATSPRCWRALVMIGEVPAALERALELSDADIGACSPALAIASSLHETQYTRLFRS